MHERDRAQSEMVGNVLLIGVIVIVSSIVALTAITNLTGGPGGLGDRPPQVDFEASATTENITLGHNGGDSLDGSDVGVRLSNDTTETEFRIDSGNLTGSDGRFDPGETFEREHGLGGKYIDVLVFVERPGSGQVLLDTTVSTRAD